MDDGIAASARAGQYATQIGGYKAFLPVPLPPDPPVQITGELQVLLSQADFALGRLDGSIQTLPNPALFVYMYVRREAVLSSQIEGTQSSLHDMLAAEAKIFTPNQATDVGEVVNYVQAMNYGLDRLSELPVSVRLIREIHTQLLRGVRGSNLAPGELRNTQNWIGRAGGAVHEAVFVPPPHQEVQPALTALERFIHDDTTLPPLIKIGLIHAQFETIHPFLDGNGRIGRLLITFLLCEQEMLQKPVLYLSHFFKQHQQRYYEELQSVRHAGTWEGWLTFFLHGVVEVGRQAADTARRIVELREDHRHLITEKFGRTAGNGHRVLEQLYEHPILSVSDVRELTGTTYQAANNLVTRMVDCDILTEFTGQARNRAFIYRDYIDLFHDGDEP